MTIVERSAYRKQSERQEVDDRKMTNQKIRAFDFLQHNPWICRFGSSNLLQSGWVRLRSNPHYFNISRLKYQITNSYLERLLLRRFDCNLDGFWDVGKCYETLEGVVVTIDTWVQ